MFKVIETKKTSLFNKMNSLECNSDEIIHFRVV